MGALRQQVDGLAAIVESALGELRARLEAADAADDRGAATLRSQLERSGTALRSTVADSRARVAAIERLVDVCIDQALQSLAALSDAGATAVAAAREQIAGSIGRAQASLAAISQQRALLEPGVAGERLTMQEESILSAAVHTSEMLKHEVGQVVANTLLQMNAVEAQVVAQIDELRAAAAIDLHERAARVSAELSALRSEIAARVTSAGAR